MDLDLRPFPDLDTSLLTMAAWGLALLLLVGTLATTRHLRFAEAVARFKYWLVALGFIGGFHVIAGFRAAQLIASVEVVVYALLWLLARTLPLRPLEDEEREVPAGRR